MQVCVCLWPCGHNRINLWCCASENISAAGLTPLLQKISEHYKVRFVLWSCRYKPVVEIQTKDVFKLSERAGAFMCSVIKMLLVDWFRVWGRFDWLNIPHFKWQRKERQTSVLGTSSWTKSSAGASKSLLMYHHPPVFVSGLWPIMWPICTCS